MVQFFKALTLRTRLILLCCLLFAVPFVFENIHIVRLINQDYFAIYAEQVSNVARFVASSPAVVNALDEPGSVPEDDLLRYLDSLAEVTQVNFIVVMDMRAIRIYHPKRDRIGKKFVGGDEGRALAGEHYVSSARGTLGFSQRAFAPVLTKDGKQVGAVSVGVLSDSIKHLVSRISAPIQTVLAACLAMGLVLSILLANRIKKILHGLEPAEIATLLEERGAMLRMVKEGILAIDLEGGITLVNAEAERILAKTGIMESLLGAQLEDVLPQSSLMAVLRSGEPLYDDEFCLNGVIVLANHMPVTIKGVRVGAISTFRDMTEMRSLAERITGINKYVDALRSQSHEFMNKLHVIFGLVRNRKLPELDAYLEQLMNIKQEENKSISDAILDPVVAGLMTGKCVRARELGVNIELSHVGVLPQLCGKTATHGLVAILGNLLDNAMEAVEDAPVKEVRVIFDVSPEIVTMTVEDSGFGFEVGATASIFAKGWSTKGESRGYGLWLVLKTVDSFDGAIDVSERPGGGASFQVALPLAGLMGEC